MGCRDRLMRARYRPTPSAERWWRPRRVGRVVAVPSVGKGPADFVRPKPNVKASPERAARSPAMRDRVDMAGAMPRRHRGGRIRFLWRAFTYGGAVTPN